MFYDIRFTAIAPDSNKPIKLIINIEAQNDFHPGYPLLDDVKVEDKLQTLSQEFGIEVTPRLEKGVAKMCNLSEGIEKRGFNKGKAEGKVEGKAEDVLEMLKDNLAISKIILYTKSSVDFIRKVAKDNNLPIREG